MGEPAMLRALRALLYKVLCISFLCKFVTRFKRIIGIKGTTSGGDLLPTEAGKKSGDGAKRDGDENEDGGDWGSWDSSEPMSIEVTGQKPKVYSSKQLKAQQAAAAAAVEPESPQPEVNFFGDMEPVIEKARQAHVKPRHAQLSSSAISAQSSGSRFAFQEPSAPAAELEAWDDNEPTSAWDDEMLDENEAEAISAEAKKAKREAERQRRQQEREQRRVQQEQKRQEHLQRKQLGMKIS